jgi:hypothetical protein
MLRLNPEQRRVLADKVPDLANLVAGALIVGRFVGEHSVSWSVTLVGIGLWIVGIAISVFLARGDEE